MKSLQRTRLHGATALLGAASLIMLAACGGSSSPAAPEGSSPTAQEGSSLAVEELKIERSTSWQEVFDTFSASELECIRSELGTSQFESAMEQEVLGDTTTEEWDASLYGCLDPDSARGLLFSMVVATFERGVLQEYFGLEYETEFGEEERSCLRDWVLGIDSAALAADDDDSAAIEVGLGMFACVPELLYGLVAQGLGVTPEELSDDEKSCLQDWVSGIDPAAFTADADDPAAIEAGLGMPACVPDLFAEGLTQEFENQGDETTSTVPDDHGNWPDDSTVAAVDTAIDGAIEDTWDIDYFAFQAESGVTYQIDIEPVTMSDPYLTLYDDFEELDYSDDYDGLAPRIYWEAPSSGTYFVAVEGFDLGTYTLTIASQ